MALRQPGSARSEEARLLWQMAALAFTFGTEIIAGVLLGWGVDVLFGTEPWGVLVGTLAGIAVGTLHLIRRAVRINREMPAVSGPVRGPSRGPFRGSPPRAASPPTTAERDAAERERQRRERGPAPGEEPLSHDEWKALEDERLKHQSANDEQDRAEHDER